MDPVELAYHPINLKVNKLAMQVHKLHVENQNLKSFSARIAPTEGPEPKVNPLDLFMVTGSTTARTYPINRVKVCTLISYLKGEPRSWANNFLEKQDPILNLLDQFLEAMSLLYEDTTKQLTAENVKHFNLSLNLKKSETGQKASGGLYC